MDTCFLYTSVLKFQPNRPEPGFGSDVVMLDLEDAVHASAKDEARDTLAALDLRDLVARGQRFGVRINSVRTIEGIRDLDAVYRACASGRLPIRYLQMPKARSREDVVLCRSLFAPLRLTPALKFFPLVETPEGLNNVEGIAEVSDVMLFGQADITNAMYKPNAAYLAQARGRFCVACAQFRIPPIDTRLFEEIQDMDRFEAGCREARDEGFFGKAIIHPKQVEPVRRAFAIDREELASYRSTIREYESQGAGFAIRDGAVVAPPFVAKARLMLELFEEGEAPEGSGRPGAGDRAAHTDDDGDTR